MIFSFSKTSYEEAAEVKLRAKRKLAAEKAWATRRKEAKKRSAAAKKAWVTRRKNAISLRQRKAALKAWKTIRAKSKSE